jgi:two-component system CheB/CheR fusion protein
VALSQDVRQIAHQLHPSILMDLGLTAALQELCEEFSSREPIETVFEPGSMPDTLPIEIASCLYRVAQEALHNVSKHSNAKQVRLTLRAGPEGITLGIQDNGAGFDSESRTAKHGMGIVSMQERVRQVQGEFSLSSQVGQGTRITVQVPLPRRGS